MQKQLENGLILRSLSEGYASDRAHLPAFYVEVFTGDYGPEDQVMGPWTEELIRNHITVTHEDIWVIVDPAHGEKIVSALLLIPQVWRYEEVEFSVGRVELVATLKEYRRRGLVRTLMEVAHERSHSLGHPVQVITGVPHYYRQFGYTMALNLGGDTALPMLAVPALAEGKDPQYTLRPATETDIPDLLKWYAGYAEQGLIHVPYTESRWRFELQRTPQIPPKVNYHIIVKADGTPVGYVGTGDITWQNRLSVWHYVVGKDASYLDTFEDVLRGLKKFAENNYPEKMPDMIMFDNGVHPTIKLMVHRTFPGRNNWRSYMWYLRVADLPVFIKQIAPALERRLFGSGAHGFTGDFGINFYDKTGLLIRFEQGRLTDACPLPDDHAADAAFPWHSFLNVLFGHRTMEELNYIMPEVYANRKASVLLEALFPVKPSWVMGIF